MRRTIRTLFGLLAGAALSLALGMSAQAHAESVRVKDLGKLQGWRENALVGTGIVTGLAGTGDSSTNRSMRQALSNAMSQFNLNVGPNKSRAATWRWSWSALCCLPSRGRATRWISP